MEYIKDIFKIFSRLILILALILGGYFLLMLVLHKTKKTVYYPKERRQAMQKGVLIESYNIISNGKKIGEGMLVGAIINRLFYEKIDLSRKHIIVKMDKVKYNKLNAFSKNNDSLMIFEEKGHIYIIGASQYMDSIKIIKDDKEEYLLIKE